MPSTRSVDPPPAALAVAKRYRSRERLLSALVVVFAVVAFVGTFVATSLVPALVVGALLIVAARAPVIDAHGTVRLRTDADAAAVAESFAGPTPPMLVFQWGLADEVVTGDGTVTYRLSYLFGLRSVAMTLDTRTTHTPAGDRRVEVAVTVDGRPWSTYVVTVTPRDAETVVTYEYTAERRFGLRRLPQRLVATRYRDEALDAQGYVPIGRDEQYGLAT